MAVTLDPLPLTAFLVVLPSEGGTRKGAAFVFGWLVSLAIVVTITVVATGNNPPKPSTAPSLAALAVKIALGAVLVVIAVRRIRTRGRPRPPKKPPKWQAHVDSMPRARSTAVTILVTGRCVLHGGPYSRSESSRGRRGPGQGLST